MSAVEALTEEIIPHEPVALSVVGPSAFQLMLDLEGVGLLTPRSLHLPDSTTYEQADALATYIAEIKTRGNFYLGDLLIDAEELLGAQFAQLSEATGLSEDARTQLIRICRAIPAQRRRNELNWTTHTAVAKLTAREQTKWLDRAVKNGWRYRELSNAIKEANAEERPQLPGTESHDPDLGLLLEASRALVHNAIVGDANVIVRVEDYHRVRSALGEGE